MSLEALDFRSSALLVVDMQNAFCGPEGTLAASGVDLSDVRATIPRIRELVEAFAECDAPVVWTLQEHLAQDARRDRKRIAPHTARRKRVAALAGTSDAQIIDELAPLAGDPQLVVHKHRFGCFYETRLDALLGMLGVDTLFVTGVTANACVDTTLREAYLRDYDVVAISDCIGAIDHHWKKVAVEVWAQYLCAVTDSTEVLRWLSARAPAAVNGLGHLLLQVNDLDRSELFYLGLLGMSVRKRETFRDGRPLVVTKEGLGLTDGRPDGDGPLEHIAFKVSDVRALAAKAKRAGVEILRGPEPSTYGLSVYLADPDGNQVELFGVDTGSEHAPASG